MAAVFAEHATIRDVGSPEPVHGRAAIRDRVADLIEAFPDLRLRQLDLVVGEDANADRWEFSRNPPRRVPRHGLPPGRSIKVEGATFSRFDEHGLVVEDVNFWDVPALLGQLGG